ncbi:MAG: 16S rRNA (cytosine(1402)-N(4))-methyltransferase RsmH [Planctomycetota bacterium]
MPGQDEPLSQHVADAASLHVPVLLETVRSCLPAGGHILDCTLGMGGHSQAMLDAGCRVTAIDRDAQARELAARRLADDGDRLQLRAGDFASVCEALVAAGECFDGVLADLGVSSLQLDSDHRAFGIRSTQALDLRMDPEVGEPAHRLIQRLSAQELADVLFEYGEERRSRRIAPALQAAVAAGRISGADLAAAIRSVVPGRHKRHPALRSFQALRIAVNDELGQLRRLLALLPRLLRAGGRGVIISFHSLEDRLVKQAFRAGLRAGVFETISKKVIVADAAEQRANPRAHAAKLRWCQRAREEES